MPDERVQPRIAGQHLPPGTRGRVALADAVDAVSYTHLRAHETVLDLVCRLLLEKKNNNMS